MTFLRSLITALALSAALGVPAGADEPAGGDDARAVIASQLDAFRAESPADAYRYAAPNVQRIFPTPRVFGQMVKRGYPMVWNPRDTEFLDAEKRGASIIQRLRIIDQTGRAHIAEYMMVMVEGEWRIAGVQIIPDETFGV